MSDGPEPLTARSEASGLAASIAIPTGGGIAAIVQATREHLIGLGMTATAGYLREATGW